MIEFVCIFNWLLLMLKSHLIIVYLSKLKIPLDFTYFSINAFIYPSTKSSTPICY